MRTNFIIKESKNIKSATNGIKKILEVKYKQADSKEITTEFKYLSSDEQFLICRLLKTHENLFDGALGNYTGTEYKIELLNEAQPYHAKPFPIPKAHEETLETDVNILVSKCV